MGISIQQGMGGGGLAAATQAEMEAASSTSVASSPGRQHFHPGHPKCWAYVTVSGGTPTLQASFNITSITDTGAGQLTITIATDFSSANWASSISVDPETNANGERLPGYSSKASGSILLEYRESSTGNSFRDPTAWDFIGFGDQA